MKSITNLTAVPPLQAALTYLLDYEHKFVTQFYRKTELIGEHIQTNDIVQLPVTQKHIANLIDASGKTPLLCGIHKGLSVPQLQILVESGADPKLPLKVGNIDSKLTTIIAGADPPSRCRFRM